jgi:hypothetical protein
VTSLVVFAVGFTTAAARSICVTMILSAANWVRRLLPTRPKFNSVIGAVWVPGLGLALSSVGFGAITTFIVLLFAQHGWGQAWLAFTLVSITFMTGRLIFGHLPDKIGGAKERWSAC